MENPSLNWLIINSAEQIRTCGTRIHLSSKSAAKIASIQACSDKQNLHTSAWSKLARCWIGSSRLSSATFKSAFCRTTPTLLFKYSLSPWAPMIKLTHSQHAKGSTRYVKHKPYNTPKFCFQRMNNFCCFRWCWKMTSDRHNKATHLLKKCNLLGQWCMLCRNTFTYWMLPAQGLVATRYLTQFRLNCTVSVLLASKLGNTVRNLNTFHLML